MGLVDEIPSEADLKAREGAMRLNEELKLLFPEFDPSSLPEPRKAPEITGLTPYLFDDPLNVNPNRYFSFTADKQNHLIEYQGGNRITLELPDGTIFKPDYGDFVRVPVGTKIKTEIMYRGGSEYNFDRWGSTSVWISNVYRGSFVGLGGGSEIVLGRSEDGEKGVINMARGEMRVDYLGSEPELPPEIQFEGRKEVKLTWDGTDFVVSYDPEMSRIIVEIYDGTIKAVVGDKKYALSSNYGGEIKRIEIDGEGGVVGRIALPGRNWREREKKETSVVVMTEKREGSNSKWLIVPVILIGLAVTGVVWHKNKYHTWLPGTEWKIVFVKLREVFVWVRGRLERK